MPLFSQRRAIKVWPGRYLRFGAGKGFRLSSRGDTPDLYDPGFTRLVLGAIGVIVLLAVLVVLTRR